MKFHLQTSIALEYGYFERTLLTLIFFFLLTSNLQKKESQTFSKERLEILTAQEATNLHVLKLEGPHKKIKLLASNLLDLLVKMGSLA